MKVLWFTTSPSLGEEFINKKPMGTGWIKSLDKKIQNEVDLTIAFYMDKSIPPFKYGNTTYYPIDRNIGTILQKFIRFRTNKIDEPSEIWKYLSLIDNVKPDIIHIHGTENVFGEILESTQIPIVFSIQGNITVYTHKFFSGIESAFSKQIFSIKKFILGNNYYKTFKKFKRLSKYEKEILSKAEYIIGRTSWDKRISSVLAPKAKYFNGEEILRESFYHNRWQNNNFKAKIKLVTTNGPSFYKGIETVIQASKILEDLKIEFEWNIAGLSKEDDIIRIIKKKEKIKKITNNIIFHGSLSELELVDLLIKSNIYVMPSHIENSPNSLCEAMIIGMPVIASYAGGTSSMLKDKIHGLLIQDGDPWVLVGAILELWRNNKTAITYGKNAKELALKRHDPELIVNNLLNTYKTIINDSKNRVS